jgi:hypothetical protein
MAVGGVVGVLGGGFKANWIVGLAITVWATWVRSAWVSTVGAVGPTAGAAHPLRSARRTKIERALKIFFLPGRVMDFSLREYYYSSGPQIGLLVGVYVNCGQ